MELHEPEQPANDNWQVWKSLAAIAVFVAAAVLTAFYLLVCTGLLAEQGFFVTVVIMAPVTAFAVVSFEWRALFQKITRWRR